MGEKLATANTKAMAQLIGIHRTHLERIAAQGFIKPRAPNCWPIVATFQGVVKYYRDESRRTNQTATQSRVATARAREIELRTAQRAGVLCEVDEALAFCDEVFGGLRSDLGGLPAMVTRDLSIRRDIETAVNSILNKTSARLEEQAKALKPDLKRKAGSKPPAKFLNQTPGT
jgi:hypothetical protein